MKKLLSLFLLLSVMTLGVQAQLLYRISGKNLSAPSYVVGTFHLASATFADSIPGMAKVQQEVTQVYGELIMDAMTNPDSIVKIQSSMMLPDGQSLTGLLTPDRLDRLNAALRASIGADFTNPMLEAQMGKLKPIALNLQMSVMKFVMRQGPGFDANNFIDSYFQKAALSQGKPVGGLETIDQQIEVLFGRYDIPRQLELLMCSVDNSARENEVVDSIIHAYYSQNLDAIKAAMDMKYDNSCDPTSEEQARLLSIRNADWLKKMPAIMEKASTLFVVGVGHLIGEEGVLQRLKAEGYTVEAVR